MELAIVFIILTAASEIIALTPLKSNSIAQLFIQVVSALVKTKKDEK